MPIAACQRCKSQKIKCEEEEGQKACIRCHKAGFTCIDAPPSRQGKRKGSNYEYAEQKDQLSWKTIEDTVSVSSSETQSAMVQQPTMRLIRTIISEWDEGEYRDEIGLLRGLFDPAAVPSRDAVYWAVRHLACLATVQDSKPLFEGTMRLAACYAIPMSELVLGLDLEMTPPMSEGGIEQMWRQVEQLSAENGDFYFSRSLNPMRTGDLVICTTQNFGAQVCTAEALQAHWKSARDEASHATLWDAFIHRDDLAVIPTALGRIVASMETFDRAKLEGKCQQTTSLFRMKIRQPHGVGGSVSSAYVPCQAEVHLGCFGGAFWICVKATPLIPAASAALVPLSHALPYPNQPAPREIETFTQDSKVEVVADHTVTDGSIPNAEEHVPSSGMDVEAPDLLNEVLGGDQGLHFELDELIDSAWQRG